MFQIIRNLVMFGTLLMGAGANIYFNLLNPYVACGLALAAAFGAGLIVERLFIRRAHGKMVRLYGEDWA